MSKTKFKCLITILILIVFISSSFITLDWARFYIVQENIKYKRFLYTNISKFLIVILTTILVFMIGNDGLSKKDTFLLRFIYLFIILADLSLGLLDDPFLGIALFSMVQIGLIYRNGTSIYKNIKTEKKNNLLSNRFINTVLTTVFVLLILYSTLRSLLNNSKLLYIMTFYAILLCISLWTAIANLLLGLLPKTNSKLIAIGMIFFVLCDMSVGLTLALKKGTLWLFIDSLIWIFYTTALTLIAISGYDERRMIWKRFI